MKTTKQLFQVHQCERTDGSVNGNPNWILTGRLFDEQGGWTLEALKTSSDKSFSYGDIPNKVHSKMPEPVSVQVELSKANKIKSLEVLDNA